MITSTFDLFTDTIIDNILLKATYTGIAAEPFDENGNWSRKIFRLYKTFKKLDAKK